MSGARAGRGTILIKPTELGLRERVTECIVGVDRDDRPAHQSAGHREIDRRPAGRRPHSHSVPRTARTPRTQAPHRRDGEADVPRGSSLDVGCRQPTLTAPPAGFKVYPRDEAEGGEYLLREIPIVQGEDLVDAQPGFDRRNSEPVINFRFNQTRRGKIRPASRRKTSTSRSRSCSTIRCCRLR